MTATEHRAPRLTRDGWTDIAVDWAEGEGEEKWLDRHGYVPGLNLGADNADGWSIRMFRRIAVDPGFLLILDDDYTGELVFVDQLQDALDLMARWAPIITAATIPYAGLGTRDLFAERTANRH